MIVIAVALEAPRVLTNIFLQRITGLVALLSLVSFHVFQGHDS